MFALAFAKDLDSAGVALLDVGLDDFRDRLSLLDVIAYRDVNGCKLSRGIGHRVDNPTAIADQNSLTGHTRRNPPDDAPCERGRQSQTNHEGQNPIKRFGDVDEVVKLFGRCGSLQRGGAECPLRQLGHRLILRLTVEQRRGAYGDRICQKYTASTCFRWRIVHKSQCPTKPAC